MDALTEIMLGIVVPALVTAALGIAVPGINEWRKKNKAGRTAIFIEVLDQAILAGIAYFKDNPQNLDAGSFTPKLAPRVDQVVGYIQKQLPESLAENKVTTEQLTRKVNAVMRDQLSSALDSALTSSRRP